MVVGICEGNFHDDIYEAYHENDLPLKMMKKFTHMDKYGGIKVAYNEEENISTYVRKVTV